MAEHLTGIGTVTTHASYADARHEALSGEADVVIADEGSTGMGDGVAFLAEVRENSPHIGTVLTVASVNTENVSRVQACSINRVLPRPFSESVLRSVVSGALEHRRQWRQRGVWETELANYSTEVTELKAQLERAKAESLAAQPPASASGQAT